jgi:hypothetical protein
MPDATDEQRRRRARIEAQRVLEKVAASKTTVTYSQLASKITAMRYAPNGEAFSELLCDISRASHGKGRGLLSAVVVHADDGLPGDGFFALAEALGRGGVDRETGWEEEVAEVYSAWAEQQASGG